MKEKEIESLMRKVLENEERKKIILGIANDQYIDEGASDLEVRNDLFAFLGTSLALLLYTDIIKLNDYIAEPNKNTERAELVAGEISKNKELFKIITDIVNHEASENESKVRLHLFLSIALAMLKNRKAITINNKSNNKSPY